MCKLAVLLLLSVAFVSCEEYYTPDLDSATSMLVVESQITNIASKNFVRLTKTQDFYETNADTKISGAKVELLETGGGTSYGKETSTGYFTLAKSAIPGKTYTLKVTYDNKTFISSPVVMPALPQIDTLYTSRSIKKTYEPSEYGAPKEVENPVFNLIVDAPISSQLKYFRYSVRSVLQWKYSPPSTGAPLPLWYGWKNTPSNSTFNIIGQGNYSTATNKIKNHNIQSLYIDPYQYLDSAALAPAGWIEIIDQYGITKEAYDFYSALNKQFVADGNLFDPVLSQIPSNIYCKTDVSIKVVGFFNVCSYQGYRYFIFPQKTSIFQKRVSNSLDIPESGYLTGLPPNFWVYY